jgi:hypothetical protein
MSSYFEFGKNDAFGKEEKKELYKQIRQPNGMLC